MNPDDLITGTLGNMGNAYKDIISTRQMINPSDIWSNSDQMYELRDYIAREASTQMDLQVLEQLKAAMKTPKEKTHEEKVIDIVNGGFKAHFGMEIYEFQAIYESIVENNPEKLI